MRHFTISTISTTSSLVALIISLSSPLAIRADEPAPSPVPDIPECPKVATTQKNVRPICVYRVHNGGGLHFDRVLEFANTIYMAWTEQSGSNPSNLAPKKGSSPGTIEWFIYDDASNFKMATDLRQRDEQGEPIDPPPSVTFTIEMYSYETGSGHDIGVEIGGFLGKHQPQTESDKLLANLTDGIISIFGVIGNPLASAFKLGIDLSIEKKHAQTVAKWTHLCPSIGDMCSFKHTVPVYYSHNVGLEKTEAGIEISLVPNIERGNPRQVELSDFSFRYGTKTDDSAKNESVDAFQPYNHQKSIIVHTDELFVLGSESKQTDKHSAKPLSDSSSNHQTQVLFLLSTTVNFPETPYWEGYSSQYPPLKIKKPEPFTKTERSALPNGQLSFKEVLESLELFCLPQEYSPKSAASEEPICGLRFTKVDQKYLDYVVRFTIDKWSLRSSLRSSLDNTKSMNLIDAAGRSYYTIPSFTDTKLTTHTLHIELISDEKESEPTRGMKFKFTHNPGNSKPFRFSHSKIKWLD